MITAFSVPPTALYPLQNVLYVACEHGYILPPKKLLLQWIQSDTVSSAQLYAKVFVEWVPEQNQCIYIFNLQIPEFMGTYNLQILAPRHFWVHTTCYICLVPKVLHTRMATIEIVKGVPIASFPGLCHHPAFVILSPDPTLLRGETVWWTKLNFLSSARFCNIVT